MASTNSKALSKKRILLYIAITFVITYLVEFLIIWPLANSGKPNLAIIAQLLIAGVMFLPAIGVLITRLITGEGFQNSYIKPQNGKKSIPYFLLGWFGPCILTALGAVVYFCVYPDRFDPEMGYLASVLLSQGVEPTPELMQVTLLSQIITGFFLSAILNFVNCFGEEWGWRGYLLPKMLEHFKVVPTLLISGIIWGLWHLPIIMLGHNYGVGYPGYPYLGILAMCIFCIVTGIFLSYVTIRTGSCIPAVLAHGSINGFAAIGYIFTPSVLTASSEPAIDPFVGPAPTGLLGGSAFLVCALVMIVLLVKKPGLHK